MDEAGNPDPVAAAAKEAPSPEAVAAAGKEIVRRARGRGGRPPKISEDVIAAVYLMVQGGNYIESAAAFVGVDKTTLYEWLRVGARIRIELPPAWDEDGEPIADFGDAFSVLTPKQQLCWEFSHSIQRALAEAEVRDLGIIGAAAKAGVWQAAAWRLQRRNPGRYGFGRPLDGTERVLEDVGLQERSGETGQPGHLVQEVMMIPASLPAEAHSRLVDELAAAGQLPGAHPEDDDE